MRDKPECILLFSGGRDSTLAAVRLAASYHVCLVTVTSDHLSGIPAVRQRLIELQAHLPCDTEWILLHQEQDFPGTQHLQSPTCLPCQLAYAAIGIEIAKHHRARRVAFGYAAYQSHWPEQTAIAVAALREVAREHSLDLLLPVYDLQSKESAAAELDSLGLSKSSLEQKCSRQQYHEDLSDPALRAEIDRWACGIREAAAHERATEILQKVVFRDMKKEGCDAPAD